MAYLLAALSVAACGRARDAGACRVGLGEPPVARPARRAAPSSWILGPLWGTGCPRWAECVSGPGAGMADEVLDQLATLERLDLPVTAFHFDGEAWASTFDGQAWSTPTCTWVLGDEVLAELRRRELPALLHFWGGCATRADFDRVHAQIGDRLGGFYLDYAYSSDFPGRGDVIAREVTEWVAEKLPGGRGDVVMKAYDDPSQTDAGLRAYGHVAYVADLPTDFEGLREGVRRVFAKAHLVGTFNELTGYWGMPVEEEVFFRRIHFGALQLVMDHSPLVNADPWRHGYSSDLLDAYRRFAWLHHELVPYLHSYDRRFYETNEPVLRDADAARFTVRLGEEIFVPYVTEAGVRELDLALPPGRWVDGWDATRIVEGAVRQPVPLGREPFFIREGSIVPLDVRRPHAGHGTEAAAGSLTLLVHPAGASSFRYWDDELARWITFRAALQGDRLELDASAAPSRPMLWRVARWSKRPAGVSACGAGVVVGDPGLPERATVAEVEGSASSAWAYDAAAQVLVVKLVADSPSGPAFGSVRGDAVWFSSR